eukprot:scaffold457911_cov79-Attheya_sp.AAC.1
MDGPEKGLRFAEETVECIVFLQCLVGGGRLVHEFHGAGIVHDRVLVGQHAEEWDRDLVQCMVSQVAC